MAAEKCFNSWLSASILSAEAASAWGPGVGDLEIPCGVACANEMNGELPNCAQNPLISQQPQRQQPSMGVQTGADLLPATFYIDQ